jgi:alkyl hydroperoxide reductase subunit AhpC
VQYRDHTAKLSIGSPAPDFSLPGTVHGEEIQFTLSERRGKWVVVLFHPVSFSPVCSKEIPAFNAKLKEFEGLGAEVIDISTDHLWVQRAWVTGGCGHIELPVLSDFWPHGRVAKEFGVFNEETGVPERAIFLVDPEGVVRWIRVYPRRELPDPEDVLAILRSLVLEVA